MKLSKVELKLLNARCDAALKRKTAKGKMSAMDNCFNIDLAKLPPSIRRKWRKAIASIALKVFTG